MRFINRMIFAQVLLVGMVSVSPGQSISSVSGTAGGTTDTGGGTNGGTGTGTTSFPAIETPILTAPSDAQTSSGAISPSNFLAPSFANPYYQGRAGAATTELPGGFGVTLYGTTTSPTGSVGLGPAGTTGTGGFGGTTTTLGGARTGAAGTAVGGGARAGGTTGFGGAAGLGTTGGLGGQTGFGGVGGTTGTAGRGLGTNSAVVVPLVRPIAYRAVLKFKPPPLAPAPVLQADLQSMLNRSTFVSSSNNVQVVADGNQIVLRGTVADDDEARLIEGMVRLTPGVSAVKNELVVR